MKCRNVVFAPISRFPDVPTVRLQSTVARLKCIVNTAIIEVFAPNAWLCYVPQYHPVNMLVEQDVRNQNHNSAYSCIPLQGFPDVIAPTRMMCNEYPSFRQGDELSITHKSFLLWIRLGRIIVFDNPTWIAWLVKKE